MSVKPSYEKLEKRIHELERAESEWHLLKEKFKNGGCVMEKVITESFGPHLMLDLRQCNQEKLKDYNLVFNVLQDLPGEIGMTKITQPYVFPYSGLIPEDKGITGTVIIAESHISIHTFQEKDYCS